MSDRVRRLEGRDDSFAAAERLERLQRFAIGDADERSAAGFLEVRKLWSDAGVVETGRNGVRLLHLAEFVLQDIRARSVQDTDCASAERRRMAPALDAVPGGLHADELDFAILNERIEDTHRIGAAADAGDDGVWQRTDCVEHL